MDELSVLSSAQLPVKLDDLTRFVLIGQEKLTVIRAEIRAINKVRLAEEVLEQKREEARKLSDLILLASVRIGELTSRIPKAGGGDRRSESFKSDTAVVFEKQPKREVIKNLGLTEKQVERFETLADNPEAVEQARANAAAENRPVTRSEVLNLAKYRDQKAKVEYEQIDEDCRLAQLLTKALTPVELLPTDKESIAAMRRGDALTIEETRHSLRVAINNLMLIQREYERR